MRVIPVTFFDTGNVVLAPGVATIVGGLWADLRHAMVGAFWLENLAAGVNPVTACSLVTSPDGGVTTARQTVAGVPWAAGTVTRIQSTTNPTTYTAFALIPDSWISLELTSALGTTVRLRAVGKTQR